MDIVFLIIVAIAALFIFAAKNKKKKSTKRPTQKTTYESNRQPEPKPSTAAQTKKENPEFNYKAQTNFFTKSEYAFFIRLVKATQETHIVQSKVRLADIITPAYSSKEKIYYSAFNLISRKHIDFILLNKNTLKIEKAIELDGISHFKKTTQKSDLFKEKSLKQCQITLVRFKVGDSFSEENIRNKLKSTLTET